MVLGSKYIEIVKFLCQPWDNDGCGLIDQILSDEPSAKLGFERLLMLVVDRFATKDPNSELAKIVGNYGGGGGGWDAVQAEAKIDTSKILVERKEDEIMAQCFHIV
ncbi:hypothetical protein HK100_010405 [Physocladia obscura]|uniref:Uncharacterized protein n=1 Tax=Physocladia obscura TaxID=109957 RepID=A0AAD5SMM1_9FUNG|nr:hypothetical protein HK100_010405 [Physocladia obscura]